MGEERTAGERATITVDNPATGEAIGAIDVFDGAEVTELVARARAAQPAWEALGFDGRAQVMRRAQKWMLDHADQVIETVVRETGKTWEDAQLTDFGYTVMALGFWAKRAQRYLADERVSSLASPLTLGKKLVVRHVPLGVVGVIGPWNYPIVNSFGDCIPALMAGNAVILKPSEVTPFSSQLMGEMLAECGLPADVYAVATGDGSTGAALVEAVDCVMFTGSTRTGTAGPQGRRRDADPVLSRARRQGPDGRLRRRRRREGANAAAFYAMNNAGQVCVSVERCYVEAPVYDAFVERVTETVRGLRQGEPDRPWLGRRRRGDLPAAARTSSRITSRTRSPRGPVCSPAESPTPIMAATTSRPCSSTSTIR